MEFGAGVLQNALIENEIGANMSYKDSKTERVWGQICSAKVVFMIL